ncbi:putative Ribonuclease Z [uncultured spirochete]|jgi:Metal-dependent hydrolases of the beta-lactamase superfamily III|uniref:Putative Ribonuclease Z n=1 Tax=uncultured spirochete TaxID=156406 RepID=A0A3P3XJK9_9SPIR|nr:MBL fold metallo-hydrolase [Rectinema subterraneum]SLM13803.1 putative Ribonuclease Z [uncultured spirochete]HBE46571.1 hypothetical protein [Spirochaetaceae bacterium]HCX95562.1 hypothetical protein [Spirochaetaceae bacterium]
MRLCFFGTSSAIPSARNGYTSFLIELANKTVLVDTGDNAIRSMLEMGRDPMMLDAIILTHEHADHLGAFPAFIAALECMNRTKKLLVIMQPELEKRVLTLLALFDYYPEQLHFELEFAAEWHTDGLKIDLLPGNHSKFTMMPRFVADNRTLLYTADTRYKAGQYAALGAACHTLIHEATYSHPKLPQDTRHSSALEAGMAASEIGARNLFLCHFQDDAYKNPTEPAIEAAQSFGGEIIVPGLMQWYTIKED